MSMKPIEFVTMAPKSWETSNQTMNQIHKQDSAQFHMAAEFGKHVQEGHKQTTKMTKADQNENRYDDNFGGSRGTYGDNQRKRKKKEEQQSKYPKSSGSTLDISI